MAPVLNSFVLVMTDLIMLKFRFISSSSSTAGLFAVASREKPVFVAIATAVGKLPAGPRGGVEVPAAHAQVAAAFLHGLAARGADSWP